MAEYIFTPVRAHCSVYDKGSTSKRVKSFDVEPPKLALTIKDLIKNLADEIPSLDNKADPSNWGIYDYKDGILGIYTYIYLDDDFKAVSKQTAYAYKSGKLKDELYVAYYSVNVKCEKCVEVPANELKPMLAGMNRLENL